MKRLVFILCTGAILALNADVAQAHDCCVVYGRFPLLRRILFGAGQFVVQTGAPLVQAAAQGAAAGLANEAGGISGLFSMADVNKAFDSMESKGMSGGVVQFTDRSGQTLTITRGEPAAKPRDLESDTKFEQALTTIQQDVNAIKGMIAPDNQEMDKFVDRVSERVRSKLAGEFVTKQDFEKLRVAGDARFEVLLKKIEYDMLDPKDTAKRSAKEGELRSAIESLKK